MAHIDRDRFVNTAIKRVPETPLHLPVPRKRQAFARPDVRAPPDKLITPFFDQLHYVPAPVLEHPVLGQAFFDLGGRLLEPGTVQGYSIVVEDFRVFCGLYNLPVFPISVQNFLLFLTYLHSRDVSYPYLRKVKPALDYLQDVYGVDRSHLDTPLVTRFLSAGKRLASAKQPPVVKSVGFHLEDLHSLINWHIIPHWNAPHLIPDWIFRTIVRMIIEYSTFCRLADYQSLRASDIQNLGHELLVTFPKAKNDVMHQGFSSKIVSTYSPNCPVQIIKLFYFRYQLHFGVPNQFFDVSHLNFKTQHLDNRHVLDFTTTISVSVASDNLKTLLESVTGSRQATDKAVKAAGVTDMFLNGGSLLQIMQQGRWAVQTTPLYYILQSLKTKTINARLVPWLAPPQV